MQYILLIISLVFAGNLSAQEITYSIYFPPGGRMGVTKLPEIIDHNHYYTHREIRELAEPAEGWEAFYRGVMKLEYPEEAKEKKQQTALTVSYRINEKGIIDTVYISSAESYGRSTKCQSCEELIMNYFREAKWNPGRIIDVPVKTADYQYVEFRIHDPNAEKNDSPFGF